MKKKQVIGCRMEDLELKEDIANIKAVIVDGVIKPLLKDLPSIVKLLPTNYELDCNQSVVMFFNKKNSLSVPIVLDKVLTLVSLNFIHRFLHTIMRSIRHDVINSSNVSGIAGCCVVDKDSNDLIILVVHVGTNKILVEEGTKVAVGIHEEYIPRRVFELIEYLLVDEEGDPNLYCMVQDYSDGIYDMSIVTSNDLTIGIYKDKEDNYTITRKYTKSGETSKTTCNSSDNKSNQWLPLGVLTNRKRYVRMV